MNLRSDQAEAVRGSAGLGRRVECVGGANLLWVAWIPGVDVGHAA